MLNYLGQGALLLRDPGQALATIRNPFFFLAPEWFRRRWSSSPPWPTMIASQAVISGAFSVTQQAIQLGFIPRMTIKHTSEHAAGQIYIPVINWGLMIMVILLVLLFQRPRNLTAAYGIAVTGAMLIDNFLLAVVLFICGNGRAWKRYRCWSLFFALDAAYFSANLIKVPDGGWVPLLMGRSSPSSPPGRRAAR